MPADLAACVHFDGNCREAMDFYVETLGARIVDSSTYGDAPDGASLGGDPDWILFARLMIGDRPIMMSDAPGPFQEQRQGFNISINVEKPEEAEQIYAAFKDGGRVRMEMQETFFAKRFAMVTDRFGTPWMISANMGGQ